VNKQEFRRYMAAARDRLRTEEAEPRNRSIINRLTTQEAYEGTSLLLTYVSFRSEADTMDLIRTALDVGKRVAVPVCVPDGKLLLPCEIHSLDELVPGTWGIPEPPEHLRKGIRTEEIDLAVVPGLAFDRHFNRLGYGGGYYDRFLPQLREDAVKIGICYDFQLVDRLPADPFDIPMDGIVTESGVLWRA